MWLKGRPCMAYCGGHSYVLHDSATLAALAGSHYCIASYRSLIWRSAIRFTTILGYQALQAHQNGNFATDWGKASPVMCERVFRLSPTRSPGCLRWHSIRNRSW